MGKMYLTNVDTPESFADVKDSPACFTLGEIDGVTIVLHLDKEQAADTSTVGMERISIPGRVRCGTLHMAVTYHCESAKYDWDGDSTMAWIEFEE